MIRNAVFKRYSQGNNIDHELIITEIEWYVHEGSFYILSCCGMCLKFSTIADKHQQRIFFVKDCYNTQEMAEVSLWSTRKRFLKALNIW